MKFTWGAELVFTEHAMGGSWDGRILGGGVVLDRAHGDEIAATRPWARIMVESDGQAGVHYHLIFQGRAKGGRRHGYYRDLSEAQMHAVRWCKNRFRRK